MWQDLQCIGEMSEIIRKGLWRYLRIMSKRTVIVSGGMLEEDFVLPILKMKTRSLLSGWTEALYFSMITD